MLLVYGPTMLGVAGEELEARTEMPSDDRRLLQRMLRAAGALGENHENLLHEDLLRHAARWHSTGIPAIPGSTYSRPC
jgi:hypothetical protein